ENMAALGTEPPRGHVVGTPRAFHRAHMVGLGNLVPHLHEALRRSLRLQERPRFLQAQLRFVRDLLNEAVGDPAAEIEGGLLAIHVDRHHAMGLDVSAQDRFQSREGLLGGSGGRLGWRQRCRKLAIRAYLLEEDKTPAALAKHVRTSQPPGCKRGSRLESMSG